MALSPNYQAWYFGVLGNAYRLAGRADEAMLPSEPITRAVRASAWPTS